MDWIKRNLVFVIGAVITLLLMAVAGWYSYSGWSNNTQEREKINQAYEELRTLHASKPAPGDGKKVDNIKLAKEQQAEAREFSQKLSANLEPVPAIPGGASISIYTACVRAGTPIPNGLTRTNVANRDYSAALQETIAQLQREATTSSVNLPPKYKFSFEKQASLVTFAPGTVESLATQLGEVKVICDVMNNAKVNSLDGIRRERIPGSPDDMQGPATDYLNSGSITNEMALIAPYEVTFRCFTPELAKVLAGFAQSPYGLIVKAVNVEPAPAGVSTDTPYAQPIYVQPYAQPTAQPQRPLGEETMMRNRYGVGGGRYSPTPTPTPNPYAVNPYAANPYAQYPGGVPPTAAARGGLQTLLKEKELKVTLLVHVVKLLPTQ